MCTGATEKQLNSQCITDEMHCDALINADCADCLEHFPFQVQLVLRTIPEIKELLLPLEDAIHQHFIPALTGRPPCSTIERDLLALPVRGG